MGGCKASVAACLADDFPHYVEAVLSFLSWLPGLVSAASHVESVCDSSSGDSGSVALVVAFSVVWGALPLAPLWPCMLTKKQIF